MSDSSDDEHVSAEEFLRALLAVSPEDAKAVRKNADTKAKPDAAKDRDQRR